MEEAFTESVVLGSPMIAVIATVFLPAAVWDADSGRYRGYFNKRALGHLLFVVFFFAILSIREGKSGPEIVTTVGFFLFLAIIISRVGVELSHHHKHKVWLHRQYHKLTDHEDPREASP